MIHSIGSAPTGNNPDEGLNSRVDGCSPGAIDYAEHGARQRYRAWTVSRIEAWSERGRAFTKGPGAVRFRV